MVLRPKFWPQARNHGHSIGRKHLALVWPVHCFGLINAIKNLAYDVIVTSTVLPLTPGFASASNNWP